MSSVASGLAENVPLLGGWDPVQLVERAFESKGLLNVLHKLRQGDEYLLVGGAVRDLIMGYPAPKDLDLMVPNGNVHAHRVLGALGPSRRNRHGNWRYFVGSSVHVDVIEPRFFYQPFATSISAVGFFDSSVNAIGIGLHGDRVLDPQQGLRDLDAGQTRLPPERWSAMSDFEGVHLSLRLMRLLRRTGLRVTNPEVAMDQLAKYENVDWTDLRRLNGVDCVTARRELVAVLASSLLAG